MPLVLLLPTTQAAVENRCLQAPPAIDLTLWQCLHRFLVVPASARDQMSAQIHAFRGSTLRKVWAGHCVVHRVTSYVLVPSEALTIYFPNM